STSPAGRFATWMVSGRVVALSGAVTTRLQPVWLAIAFSASRTVPRGWAREIAGELSGSRPSSRRLSGGADQARPGRLMRATTRTTISLVARMSDLPSPGSTVERAAYFTSPRAIVPARRGRGTGPPQWRPVPPRPRWRAARAPGRRRLRSSIWRGRPQLPRATREERPARWSDPGAWRLPPNRRVRPRDP